MRTKERTLVAVPLEYLRTSQLAPAPPPRDDPDIVERRGQRVGPLLPPDVARRLGLEHEVEGHDVDDARTVGSDV